jgi:DNA-binding SARP family transcriptional activator
MDFRILGPLEVIGPDGAVDLGAARPRAILAMLLLHANEPVSAERIAVALWGEDTPAGAVKTTQVHVSRLRKTLRDPELVTTTPAGYCLRVLPGELDAERFDRLVERGQRALADGRAETAAEALREALALWRGPPLADLAFETFARGEIERLEERRLAVLELRVNAELSAGWHGPLVAELQQLVADHPTRETFVSQLMLALYRSGRQAEALETYVRARRALVAEIGVEPGPELRRLHDAILRQDEEILSPAGGAPAMAAAPSVPAVPAPPVGPRMLEGAFVGREGSLEHLRALWNESRAAHTRLALLVGEAGVGKTRLAAHFGDEVHRDGGALLYGRAEEEALLAYQPFAEALGHLVAHGGSGFAAEVARELEILSPLFPGLGPHGGAVGPPDDTETGRYQVFEAVASMLRQAAARRPVLLVLDDLHWADQPTLLLLRHVLRRCEGARLLVLGTFRKVEVARDHPLARLVVDLRRERRYDRLELEGLDEEATHALVEDRLGLEVTPRFVRRLREQTEGNAFFIEETIRALEDAGLPADAVVDEAALETLGVPEGVANVIEHHVGRLSPEAAEVLMAASVVGRSFGVGIAGQLVDLEEDRVLTAFDEGIAAGLVLEVPGTIDLLTFSHALVREVLYEGLSTHRSWLHYRLARALERQSERGPVNPAELAHHFELAGDHAGPDLVRRYAIAAGRRARELFAYEEAAKHFKLALATFDEDGPERCEVLLALGGVQWDAGDDGARRTFMEAAESAERRKDADQLSRAALGLGERYFEVTYVGLRYRRLLERADELQGPGDSPTSALLKSRLAANLAFPNESARGHELATAATAMARRLGDDKLLAKVLLNRHVTLLDVRYVRERLELSGELAALVGGSHEIAAEHHHWREYDLLAVGDLDEARREHAELEALAERLNQPVYRAIVLSARGLWAELEGDVERAEHWAAASRRYLEAAHMQDAESSFGSQVFAQRRHQGAIGDLEPLVRRLAETGGHQIGWRSALGVLLFETGRPEEARKVYDEEMAEGVTALPRGMFWLTRIALLSELCAMLGDAAGARAIYAELEPHREHNVVVAYCSFWGPVERYLALLAQAFDGLPLARRHAAAALERARRLRAPLLVQDLEERHARLNAAA